jgi:hypothetical protein
LLTTGLNRFSGSKILRDAVQVSTGMTIILLVEDPDGYAMGFIGEKA